MARMSLRDDQWERIRPLLPGKQTDCGVTAKDNRTFLELENRAEDQVPKYMQPLTLRETRRDGY